MPECPCLAKCPFFNDQMDEKPELADVLKKKLCQGDNSTCARFMVFSSKGSAHVPSDLKPLDSIRAKAICSS